MTEAHLGGDEPTQPPTDRYMDVDSEERKRHPVFSGFLTYFPNAVYEVSRLSLEANEKHNPGERLHWAREKSVDTLDCLARHILDGEWVHVAWRAMENLERQLEAGYRPCHTLKTSGSETGSQSPPDTSDALVSHCKSLGLPLPSLPSQTFTGPLGPSIVGSPNGLSSPEST